MAVAISPPAGVSRSLASLLEETKDRGIRLDVREEVLERWLAPASGGPDEARRLLAEAWERSLEAPGESLGLSISHTRGISAAASQWRADGQNASIGIDVERATREVSQRVMDRINHPGDHVADLDPIGVWALKEALFKADIQSSAHFLSDCRVEVRRAADQLFVGSGESADSVSRDLSVQIVDGLVLALAF